MRKILMLAMVLGLLVVGCTVNPRINLCEYYPNPLQPTTATVGEPIFILKESTVWEHWEPVRPGAIGQVKRTSYDMFERRLIYLGMMGDTLRIGYREYRDNYARPAYYEELTFPKAINTFYLKGVTITLIEILPDQRFVYQINPVKECGLPTEPRPNEKINR